MKMKTDFDFECGPYKVRAHIFEKTNFNPRAFVKIYTPLKKDIYISGGDLRVFANNILKALKAKRKKP